MRSYYHDPGPGSLADDGIFQIRGIIEQLSLSNDGHNDTSSTKLTSLTWLPARSSRTGMRSKSSLSWASENQLLMGTACCGWKM